MTAKLEAVANHPNRGGNRFNNAAANPTKEQVAAARAGARGGKGMTQEEFGALVYKGWRTVQDWESGERRMPPDTWQLIQVKLKAEELVKRGRIAPQALKDLGLQLPGED